MEWPVLLLALWALVLIPFSTDPGQSAVYYRRFFLFSALWCAAAAGSAEGRRRALAAALLGGAAVASLIGQILILVRTGSLLDVRLGMVSNPMTSGCLLMLTLLVGAGFLLQGGLSGRARWTVAAACVPILLGLIQTMTRSAWLGLACGLGLMLLVARPRLLAVYAALILAAILLVPRMAHQVPGQRLADRLTLQYLQEGQNTSRRLDMWKAGWRIVQDHPWTGVGDRDLLAVMPQYYGDPDTVYFGHLHSNPVMLAVIWGIPGFLLAMGFFLATLVQPWRRWRSLQAASSRPPPWRAGWILGAIGAGAGFFVAGLTEWYFGDAESMLLFLAILGTALTRDPGTKE
jgi:O-antigen ligase